MNDDFFSALAEIQRLLAEGTEHALQRDGHCKSSEGAISIHLPAFFWREDGPITPAVEVYSYVLGPHRSHYFDNINIALYNVRQWHAAEMGAPVDEDVFADADLKPRR